MSSLLAFPLMFVSLHCQIRAKAWREWLIFWVSFWKIWFRVGVSEQAHTGLESWFCLLAQVLGFLSHSPNHSDHFLFAQSSFNSSLAALWDILEISGQWSTWELSGTSLVLTAAMFSFYSMFDEFIHLGWKFCLRISKVCCCLLASVAAEADAIRNLTSGSFREFVLSLV